MMGDEIKSLVDNITRVLNDRTGELGEQTFIDLKNPLFESEEFNGEGNDKLIEAYRNINDFIQDYMDMDKDACKFTSMWIIGTYFHHQFETYPYLFFNAMRGSGKTRMLKIISSIANLGDGTIQNDMREAVLFRMQKHKILCIDEFENVGSKEKQTLRQILNSAYKKGLKISRMKKVKNFEGEKFETEEFEPYMPIAMANIWGMDEVLGDRAITLILEKSNNPAITKKIEDFKDNEKVRIILELLKECSLVQCSYVKTYIKEWNNYINNKYKINTIYTTTQLHNYTTIHNKQDEFFDLIDNAGIDGRNFELILPILITAKYVGNEVFDDILRISKDIVHNKRESEFEGSKDVSLYEFIALKQEFSLEFTPIKTITSEFREFIGEQEKDDYWLNEKWVGRALKRLGLIVKSKRMNKGVYVMVNNVKAQEKVRIFK